MQKIDDCGSFVKEVDLVNVDEPLCQTHLHVKIAQAVEEVCPKPVEQLK